MKHTFLILISFLFILSACGPSVEEKAAEIAAKEKAKQDSITIADYRAADEAANKTAKEKAIQDSIRMVDSLAANAAVMKEQLEQYLIELKAELEAEESAMSRIKEYQFGRPQWQKEEQIKNQSVKIQTLGKNIKDTEKQIESYQ